MQNKDELFWNANVEDMERGYKYDFLKGEYVCLFCGKSFIKGVIYPHQDMLFEAEKAAQSHVETEHGSVFEYLINMHKKYNDLSDIQKDLLKYFYKGMSDKEIVELQGGGSTSTIRSHRFKLKEKETQAKAFLAIMRLLDRHMNEDVKMEKLLKILTQSEVDELIKSFSQ